MENARDDSGEICRAVSLGRKRRGPACFGTISRCFVSSRTVKPDDLLALRFVRDGKLSPDGSLVAYAVYELLNARYRRIRVA